MTGTPLLHISDLQVHFETDDGLVRAVDGLDLEVREGEAVGLVGESGSGKSVAALATLHLVETPPGIYAGGEILFRGRDLLKLREKELRRIRGRQIGMVFQEPMTALNPVIPVGEQIAEGIRRHQGDSRAAARQRAVALLEQVGIRDPEQRYRDHPHQLSGGMRQRAMIAAALACEPALLIADEPTTALDVTVQARILELFNQIRRDRGTALLLISHDLDVVAEVVDRVLVMYAGRVVEAAATRNLFESARHPYTRGLLASRPPVAGERVQRLQAIPGTVPGPGEQVPGCRFHPRCEHVQERCRAELPRLRRLEPGCWAACHLAEEIR